MTPTEGSTVHPATASDVRPVGDGMRSIYLSGWSPRGAKKAWERCSIGSDSAAHIFGVWVADKIIDACAWFDENGALRILVADTATGKRATYRSRRSGAVIELDIRP